MKLLIEKRIPIKIVLLFLLSATIVVFLVSKEQKLLEEFKSHLEIEVARALSREVDIEGISGGIFAPITLRNVRIAYSKEDNNESLLTIEQIKVNKKIWDVLFIKRRFLGTLILKVDNATLYLFGNFGPKIKNQKGEIVLNKKEECLTIDISNRYYVFKGKATDIYKVPSLDMKLEINSQFTDGYIVVKGKSDVPNVTGHLNLFGLIEVTLDNIIRIEEEKIIFDNLIIQDNFLVKGEFNLNSKEAGVIVQSQGEDKIKITFNSKDNLKFSGSVEINHLKIGGCDVVADFESGLCVNKTQDERFDNIKGDLRTNFCILDYRPIEDIEGSFTYSQELIDIDYLKLGDKCKLSGFVSFEEPEKIDLALKIDKVQAENLNRFSFVPDDFSFSSIVSCEVTVKGDLKEPDIRIHLVSGPGSLRDMNFESLIINLEGKYPILDYHGSKVIRDNSCLTLEGKLDLRKIKTNNFFEDAVVKSDKETIVWEGWDITKKKTDSELKLRKSAGDDISFLYRTYLEDETVPEENNKDSIELEYKVWGNKSLKMKLNKDEEFFGFENKIKF